VLEFGSRLQIEASRKNIVNKVHPTSHSPLFFYKQNDIIGMVVSIFFFCVGIRVSNPRESSPIRRGIFP
jgi:hypothetical protein